MFRIQANQEQLLLIKKSKFICYLQRCLNEKAIQENLQAIKKMHPKANHITYACIIGEDCILKRSSDDGEPSGTAGKPMLATLMQHDLQDVLAITVRYFGGIKLGANHLARAYASSVALSIESATLMQLVPMNHLCLVFNYVDQAKIDHFLRLQNIHPQNIQYNDRVTYHIFVQQMIDEHLNTLTSGNITITFIDHIIQECMYHET